MDSKQALSKIPDQAIGALMSINQITYQMAPEISVAKQATHQEDLFQQDTYSSGEMVLIAQTGSAYVNPKQSYIKFTITATADAGTPSFGVGSLTNVIDQILIESRTGVDLDRLRSANLFIKNYQDWSHSPQWKAGEGVAQGYSPKADFKEDTVNSTLAVAKTYCLPLCDLCPLFRPEGGVYLPPFLMEGLRIRLLLAPAMLAVASTAIKTTASFTITRPRIVWHVTDLMDVFKRKLTEIASSRGLAIMYRSVHQQAQVTTATTVNQEINKAASKALRLFLVPRLQSQQGSTIAISDAMSSSQFDFLAGQLRIGNMYFPQKPLQTASVADYYEFYKYSRDSAGYETPQEAPVVMPTSGAGGYGSTLPTNSKSCIIWSLNKSSVNGLDGYIVNNSRSLICDFDKATAESTRYDFFLEYLRVALVFVSNVDVKD